MMSMWYLKWDERSTRGLEFDGIVTLYTEVNEQGDVTREVGINSKGQVVHRCPARGYKYGTYGVFDNAKIGVSGRHSDLTKAEFERLWNQCPEEGGKPGMASQRQKVGCIAIVAVLLIALVGIFAIPLIQRALWK